MSSTGVNALLKPLAIYTGLLGLIIVSAVYLATHSGLYMLGLTGVGMPLVVLGGGVVSQTGPGNVEHAGERDRMDRVVSNTGLWSPVETDTSLRLTLLCYRVGAFLRSLVMSGVLRDTLVWAEPHASATVARHPSPAIAARRLPSAADSARELRFLPLGPRCRV